MTRANKNSVLEFIRERSIELQENGNTENVARLEGWEEFWHCKSEAILGLILKNQHLISSRVKMLPYSGLTDRVKLTRFQIFLIISSMFFGLIPPQFGTQVTSLIDLMSVKPSDR